MKKIIILTLLSVSASADTFCYADGKQVDCGTANIKLFRGEAKQVLKCVEQVVGSDGKAHAMPTTKKWVPLNQ